VRKKMSGQRAQPNRDLAADGFNIWWEETLACQATVTAQAFALVVAHRDRSGTPDKSLRGCTVIRNATR
jgi:hypothetical protein